MSEIQRLRQEIERLSYRVESFGDLGAERELEGRQAELRALIRKLHITDQCPPRLVPTASSRDRYPKLLRSYAVAPAA